MKIVIVAPFCSLKGEPYFNRFLYLAEVLSRTHSVVLVTSKFRHFDKRQRVLESVPATSYKVVLIDEPGYRQNISLGRVYSHHSFVSNFNKWLDSYLRSNTADLVYSAYPLLATNIQLGGLKRRFGFCLVVDVQDVWPEAISAAIPFVKSLPRWLVPFSGKADRAYKSADYLVAVSKTYLARAKSSNAGADGMVVYIGGDGAAIERVVPAPLSRDEIHFAYMGTVSHSYDLDTVIAAFNRYFDQGKNYRLHILGDGPGLEGVKLRSRGRVNFYGFVAYDAMVAVAKSVDFLLNPIKASAMQSVTNKLSDYFLLEKPIISSQENDEVDGLLEEIQSSRYVAGSVDSFIRAVEEIQMKKPPVTESLARRFDRRNSYPALVAKLEELCSSKFGD